MKMNAGLRPGPSPTHARTNTDHWRFLAQKAKPNDEIQLSSARLGKITYTCALKASSPQAFDPPKEVRARCPSGRGRLGGHYVGVMDDAAEEGTHGVVGGVGVAIVSNSGVGAKCTIGRGWGLGASDLNSAPPKGARPDIEHPPARACSDRGPKPRSGTVCCSSRVPNKPKPCLSLQL